MQKSAEGDGAVYVAVYGIISRLEGATNFARSREVQLGILIIDSLVHCGTLISYPVLVLDFIF